jgi:P4 family phage/plasmid primase-like protien
MPRVVGVQGDIAELVAVNVLIGRFRYVAGLGWHQYVGGCWVELPKTSNLVHDAVREFLKMKVDDYRAEDRGGQASLWKAALTHRFVGGVLGLAMNMNGVLADPSELDHGPDLVNCRNGVLDLRTGMINRHNPGLLLTKQTGATYEPGAQSRTWDQLLEAVPTDVRPWLQLRFGQALSGWSEQSLVLTVGGGQNGKSTFMAAVLRAFGSYAGLISHRVLLQSNSGQHPTELMDLRGLRLALLEETPEEGNLDPHQLKAVVGTPYITARRMRQDSITFKASHSLFINTNHYPLVSTTDHGTWRRLVACRFPFTFVTPGDAEELRAGERWGNPDLESLIDRDPDLPAAVLAWVVEGARRWYAQRASLHTLPPSVRQATTEWRADSDVGYQFADEFLELAPHHLIPSSYLTDKFNEFLEAQGKRKWSARVVTGRLPKSIEAALGREVGTDRRRVLARHVLGIADPFDSHTHTLKPETFVRAWEGIRFKSDNGAYPTTVVAPEPAPVQAYEDVPLPLELP